LVPPPTRTAYLSRILSPGAVLRVSRIFAPVPATVRTKARVAVAMPHMRWKRFRAVRSAMRIDLRDPAISASFVPGTTSSPSAVRAVKESPGSTARKVSRKVSSPARTRPALATARALPVSSPVRMALHVTSPGPMSSARAARISRRRRVFS